MARLRANAWSLLLLSILLILAAFVAIHILLPDIDEVASELDYRTREAIRIRDSVMNELRQLESDRRALLSQVSELKTELSELESSVTLMRQKLSHLQVDKKEAEIRLQDWQRQQCDSISKKGLYPPPLRWSQGAVLSTPTGQIKECSMTTCFDYTRCSLLKDFTIKLVGSPLLKVNDRLLAERDACLELAFNSECSKDSVNRLVISTDEDSISSLSKSSLCMVAKSDVRRASFQANYDLILPFLADLELPYPVMSTPVRRLFLVSFDGYKPRMSTEDLSFLRVLRSMNKLASVVVNECTLASVFNASYSKSGDDAAFLPCMSEESRLRQMSSSIFTVIPVPFSSKLLSSSLLQKRLSECLRASSIPVVIGPATHSESFLPLQETIDWKKLSIVLPYSRLPELPFLLRTFSDEDIFAMRQQGQHIWQNYLSSRSKIVASVLAVIRERLLLPPPVENPFVPSGYHHVQAGASTSVIEDWLAGRSEDDNEILGPVNSESINSLTYTRNFSALLIDNKERWHRHASHVFSSFPNDPWQPMLPSDAHFQGGFRAINDGQGGAGKEFRESLGGNYRAEEFTAVILTYQREQVLVDAIQRLNGVPYLNKIIVVWNSPDIPPSPSLSWPTTHVPLVVLEMRANSLNNRFLPFSEINTEAVLALDDDVHLRHDEIVFAFRVWRENRDRLVGFPARFHAWDGHNWFYNSNHTCQLSMVLTGAAFYHNHYNYLYSRFMSKMIRDKVDELMNCEDLAMNFLVSHVTRQPPLKTTSRWTFRCPSCEHTLSEDEEHFRERHECMNFFTKIFGYMPLLHTQLRADSVLFKTKLPQDKEKCFKYI